VSETHSQDFQSLWHLINTSKQGQKAQVYEYRDFKGWNLSFYNSLAVDLHS